MKCFYQVVSVVDGTRSDAFSLTPQAMAMSLRRLMNEVPECADDLVLVLVDDIGSGHGEWGFSKAPMLKVSSFVELFSNTEVNSNV